MEAVIRPAKPTDAKEILRLIQELAIYEKHTLNDVKITEDIIRENGFGASPHFQILVAECDNHLVGYAFYFYSYSAIDGKRNIYLEDLYVHSDYRARKLGKKLIIELAKVGRDMKCGKLEWHVLSWNKSALKFYTGIGAELKSDLLKINFGKTNFQKFIDME